MRMIIDHRIFYSTGHNIAYIKIILITQVSFYSVLQAGRVEQATERWLYDQYTAGNLDTLRSMVENIPEQSAGGQFIRGIFEQSGESAKFYFDRSVALYSGSIFEAVSLERLWQHHWAAGDTGNARRYLRFLQQRHSKLANSMYIPDFSVISDLTELSNNKNNLINWSDIKQKYWTIQLGAFSKRNGALWVANKARPWGQVKIIDKKIRGKVLTAVHLGKFSRRSDASDLESRIRAETDLKGRVISVNP